MKQLAIVIAIMFLLLSCQKAGQAAQYQGVDEYSPQYLFTVDSVKVYRFWDNGYPRYLAIGGAIINQQSTKNSTWQDQVINTVK